jgi:hypothetical protein
MRDAAFRRDAQRLVDRELRRRRGALARLPADRRVAVEESVARAVAASVDGVLERAREDPLVAAALESVYGERSVPIPVPAGAD